MFQRCVSCAGIVKAKPKCVLVFIKLPLCVFQGCLRSNGFHHGIFSHDIYLYLLASDSGLHNPDNGKGYISDTISAHRFICFWFLFYRLEDCV